MTRLEPATPRDIPAACVLLLGAGIAALGAAAHAVGDGLERIAVAMVVRFVR